MAAEYEAKRAEARAKSPLGKTVEKERKKEEKEGKTVGEKIKDAGKTAGDNIKGAGKAVGDAGKKVGDKMKPGELPDEMTRGPAGMPKDKKKKEDTEPVAD